MTVCTLFVYTIQNTQHSDDRVGIAQLSLISLLYICKIMHISLLLLVLEYAEKARSPPPPPPPPLLRINPKINGRSIFNFEEEKQQKKECKNKNARHFLIYVLWFSFYVVAHFDKVLISVVCKILLDNAIYNGTN